MPYNSNFLRGPKQQHPGAWEEGNHTSDSDQIWFKKKEGAKLGLGSHPLIHPREPQSRTHLQTRHTSNLQEKYPCFHQHTKGANLNISAFHAK